MRRLDRTRSQLEPPRTLRPHDTRPCARSKPPGPVIPAKSFVTLPVDFVINVAALQTAQRSRIDFFFVVCFVWRFYLSGGYGRLWRHRFSLGSYRLLPAEQTKLSAGPLLLTGRPSARDVLACATDTLNSRRRAILSGTQRGKETRQVQRPLDDDGDYCGCK